MKFKDTKSKGFSLTEMLVAIAIIGILCTVVLVNYNSRKRVNALNLGAEELAGALREAQNMAMSGNLVEVEGVQMVPYGYGIYINIPKYNKEQYILFADVDGDHEYNEDSADIEIEAYSLPPGKVEIKGIKFSPFGPYFNKVNVVFNPPEPKITIRKDVDGRDKDSCIIILVLEGHDGTTKAVKVNAISGQIDIK